MTLPTRRALWAGVAAALIAAIGYKIPGASLVLLVVDGAILAGIWVDGLSAPLPQVTRDAPTAYAVGRATSIAYRWVNPSARSMRLRVREVRPDVLGGVQPPRRVVVGPQTELSEAVRLLPPRRGRAPSGTGGS